MVEGEKTMGDPYRLCESIVEVEGESYSAYGLSVKGRRIENITCDRGKLERLILELNAAQLDEKYLPWILSDFLNDKAFFLL